MNTNPDFERMVGLGILTVVAAMSWPIWLELIAAKHEWTWAVAASALIPLGLTLAVILAAAHVPSRIHRRASERLHRGPHRHA